jgi:monothiol glutaredoxin
MSIQEQIKELVETNDVVLFMKGSPDFPQCGFSSRATQILKQCGAKFASVDVLQNQDVREGIKQYSNWPTIPQLYVRGEFIGGSDIVMEMFENGELQKKLSGER